MKIVYLLTFPYQMNARNVSINNFLVYGLKLCFTDYTCKIMYCLHVCVPLKFRVNRVLNTFLALLDATFLVCLENPCSKTSCVNCLKYRALHFWCV